MTGFPEMLDGRVKTLHPAVHGGILAVRDNKVGRVLPCSWNHSYLAGFSHTLLLLAVCNNERDMVPFPAACTIVT